MEVMSEHLLHSLISNARGKNGWVQTSKIGSGTYKQKNNNQKRGKIEES
jgi:hypothetical protein